MSELRVRDHSQPCEHGMTFSHNQWGNPVKYWKVSSGCPGGREIVLRETTIKDMTLKADTPIWAEVAE